MTLIVLALDALDRGLVEHFDIEAFQLGSEGEIETFAHSQDTPYTPEVWATVATGRPPEDHGITGSGTSEWENPLLSVLSRATGRLNESTRGTLGGLVRRHTGERERIGETDADSVFDRDGAVVHNWPGVHDGAPLQRAWDLMNAASEGAPRHEFERDLFGLCAEQFGWAREMLNHPVSLAGVHVHTLDAAGHAYADDEAALRRAYERVGEFVAGVEAALGAEDDLLILSDHGMRTAFYPADEGEDPAGHSWRAYASTTADDHPRSVYDVREWIEARVTDAHVDREGIDMPTERLRELGYLE
ncbi:alkaline phosphatase family protein [Halalkalicoccus subterraneus]|uniref:alkaline phosphatase family protein n=1 Tax=Halalkalicoccus subterraneus TaxID=2675002 RepID=UPI000EFDA62D|nr:alkaline phosphatase family protein [Halalkalicoccus subterraneus]